MKNHQNKFNVKDKTIAIIGATGILGEQYVEYLTAQGAKVIIGDINFDACKELHLRLKKKKRKTLPIRIDVTDEKSIISFFNEIESRLGGFDVLINNAQIKPKDFYANFENYTKKTLEKVLDGNLIGVTISCREACKHFLKQGKGIIVNVASTYGVVAPDQRLYEKVENIYDSTQNFSSPISYAVSKAGVIQLTRYLASYYREKEIRINCLTPGGVFDNHDKTFNEQYSYRTTIGRMANKDDYNGAILFLCSEASSYMSGANLIVDGGWTAI